MSSHLQPGAVFLRSQARIMLKQRYILLMGDSVQRGMYKDLVALLHDGHLMGDAEKRAKGEPSYRTDHLLNVSELTNNTNFTEVREYVGYMPLTDEEKRMASQGGFHWTDTVLIRYAFLTRAWNDYVKEVFDALTKDYFPDVICINSTFWDISRWDETGDATDRNGKVFYPMLEQNVEKLCEYINKKEIERLSSGDLERPCLKIWRTAMPIGTNCKGGLLLQELSLGDENSATYREDMARCNLNLKPILANSNWDILDAQFWFRAVQDDHREDDGIHWNALAHRWLTNIFLSHISAAWGHGWPKYPACELAVEENGPTTDFDGVPLINLRSVITEYFATSRLPGPEDHNKK